MLAAWPSRVCSITRTCIFGSYNLKRFGLLKSSHIQVPLSADKQGVKYPMQANKGPAVD